MNAAAEGSPDCTERRAAEVLGFVLVASCVEKIVAPKLTVAPVCHVQHLSRLLAFS